MYFFMRLELYLLTNDNQYGFKHKHGTDMCVVVILYFHHYIIILLLYHYIIIVALLLYYYFNTITMYPIMLVTFTPLCPYLLMTVW